MTGTNLIVFRDSSKQVLAKDLAADLVSAVQNIRSGDSASALDALILSGQIESALSDCGWPGAEPASGLTNAIADRFVESARHGPSVINSAVAEVLGSLPQSLKISEPEGFAYYALHPGDFADAVRLVASAKSVALIGIRSIGTTLSAVAMAQLRKEHIPASRTTVRPVGHPYDRQTHFTPVQVNWINQHKAIGSTFLVLDEGPGLSGSSFLSVGESLVDSGVQAHKILLIGTRECNPSELCAKDAAQRWIKFGWTTVPSRIQQRYGHLVRLSGGAWRKLFCSSPAEWPASWMAMESLRFLTSDQKNIVKFGGFGRSGRDALERARGMCQAGFGPAVEDAGDGMHSYRFVDGHPAAPRDLSADWLEHIARYCAFRANEFAISGSNSNEIRQMIEFNFAQETGSALDLPANIFETDTSVVIDGRMQPHEWILSRSGAVLKVDAVQHGDDHFLPGPTDIAWDLAGAIVEWNMSDEAAGYLCTAFRRYTRIGRLERLPYFVLAYSIFRLAYCQMAMHATTQDAAEKTRFQRLCGFYRNKAKAAHCATVDAVNR